MANFIERIEGFSFNPALTEDAWTGTRAFVQVDNPSTDNAGNLIAEAALPALGSIFPPQSGFAIPATLIARDYKITHAGGDQTLNKVVLVNYATKDNSNENSPSDEDTVEDFSTGYDTMDLSTGSGTNAAKNLLKGAGNTVPKFITFRIYTGSYSITVPAYTTMNLALASMATPGTVDAASENWLIAGGNVSQYRNDEGDTVFKVQRQYVYKKILGPVNNITDNGHQALFNFETDLKWENPGVLNYPTSANPDTMPTIP